MKECIDCEYQGYSPEVCTAHIRSSKLKKKREVKPISSAVKVGLKTVAGAGLGVAVVIVGGTAVSLVGGTILVHALVPKFGAFMGFAGGAYGFYKGIKTKRLAKTSQHYSPGSKSPISQFDRNRRRKEK